MADKRYLPSFLAINAGDMSASITSPASRIKYDDNIVYSLIWSNGVGLSGNFSFEVSVDHVETDAGVVTKAGTWEDLGVVGTDSNPPIVSGASGHHTISMNQIPAPFIRCKWNRTGGTGTLNVFVAGKGL
jgi:hypothetical protein